MVRRWDKTPLDTTNMRGEEASPHLQGWRQQEDQGWFLHQFKQQLIFKEGGVFQRLQFKLLERIHGNNTVRKGVMICPDGGQTTRRTAQYRPRAHRAYEYKYRTVAHNLS